MHLSLVNLSHTWKIITYSCQNWNELFTLSKDIILRIRFRTIFLSNSQLNLMIVNCHFMSRSSSMTFTWRIIDFYWITSLFRLSILFFNSKSYLPIQRICMHVLSCLSSSLFFVIFSIISLENPKYVCIVYAQCKYVYIIILNDAGKRNL